MKLPADTGPSLDRGRISTTSNADVRYWYLADFLETASAFNAAHSPKVGRTITKNLCAVAKQRAQN